MSKHPLPALLIAHAADLEAERLRDQLATIFSVPKGLSSGDIRTGDLIGNPVFSLGVTLLYRSNPLAYKTDVEHLSSILNRYGIEATVKPMDPVDWEPGIEVHVGENRKKPVEAIQ